VGLPTPIHSHAANKNHSQQIDWWMDKLLPHGIHLFELHVICSSIQLKIIS
jgi:hypothetical protein